MSKSITRVKVALEAHDLTIDIIDMPDCTRTAEEAAIACKCKVGQIVKSMVFEGAESGALKLILVSGDHQADLDAVALIVGEKLGRADPRVVRKKTGFAIGGVSPIGHLEPLPTFMDAHLLSYDGVWAAAGGGHHSVFEINPKTLAEISGAQIIKVTR
jgi:prolyl-tRNA editing enzyme YbaK/EbsC (Cys-tRNA(Pro) deacylase)